MSLVADLGLARGDGDDQTKHSALSLMTLKRYLLTVYALTLSGFVILCALMAGDPAFPVGPMLVMSPIFALANTFVNVWPWARMVPAERRTSFRSYRATNIFMAFGGALLVLVMLLKIAELVGF